MDANEEIAAMEEPNFKCVLMDGPLHGMTIYLPEPWEEFCPVVTVEWSPGQRVRRVAVYRLTNRNHPRQYRFHGFQVQPQPAA